MANEVKVDLPTTRDIHVDHGDLVVDKDGRAVGVLTVIPHRSNIAAVQRVVVWLDRGGYTPWEDVKSMPVIRGATISISGGKLV